MGDFLLRWAGNFLLGMLVLGCMLLSGAVIMGMFYGLYLLVGGLGLVVGVLVFMVAMYTLAVTGSEER